MYYRGHPGFIQNKLFINQNDLADWYPYNNLIYEYYLYFDRIAYIVMKLGILI